MRGGGGLQILPPSPVLSQQRKAHPVKGTPGSHYNRLSSLLPGALTRTSVSSAQAHPACVTVTGNSLLTRGIQLSPFPNLLLPSSVFLNLPDKDTWEISGDPPSMMCLNRNMSSSQALLCKTKGPGVPQGYPLSTMLRWDSVTPLGLVTQVTALLTLHSSPFPRPELGPEWGRK